MHVNFSAPSTENLGYEMPCNNLAVISYWSSEECSLGCVFVVEKFWGTILVLAKTFRKINLFQFDQVAQLGCRVTA